MPVNASDLELTPIPHGAVAWWPGTDDTIPSGWAAVAALCDGKFPKGCTNTGDTPGTAGGSATHTHTVASHNHASSAGPADTAAGPRDQYGYSMAAAAHTHTSDSKTVAVSTGDNVPPYLTMIPVSYEVAAGGAGAGPRIHDIAVSGLLPYKLILGWNASATAPTGWTKCDGSTVNGYTAPSFLGKYLKGIPNTGTNPGTTGGATTHAHTANHTHAASGVGSTKASQGADTDNQAQANTHTHTLNSATVNTDAASNDPPFQQIHYIAFTGHGTNQAAHALGTLRSGDLATNLAMPSGMVCIWADTVASVPSGYSHCDGGSGRPNLMGKYMQHVASTTTHGGSTGGSTTHSGHTAAHTHVLNATANTDSSCEAGNYGSRGDHTHTSGAESYSNLGDATNHEPPIYEVAFLVKD